MFGDDEHIKALLERAERARGHAKRLTDARTVKILGDYAEELESQAAALRKKRDKTTKTTLPEAAANAPTGEPQTGPDMLAAAKITEPREGDA